MSAFRHLGCTLGDPLTHAQVKVAPYPQCVGLLTNQEVLEEIKVVRREMEGKQGR